MWTAYFVKRGGREKEKKEERKEEERRGKEGRKFTFVSQSNNLASWIILVFNLVHSTSTHAPLATEVLSLLLSVVFTIKLQDHYQLEHLRLRLQRLLELYCCISLHQTCFVPPELNGRFNCERKGTISSTLRLEINVVNMYWIRPS